MADILKNAKFLLLLCVIAVVVTTSGCTVPGNTVTGGPGLVIETFKTTPDNIESNEHVGVQLEARNMGGYNGQAGMGVQAVAEIMAIDPIEWRVTPSAAMNFGPLLMPDPESQTQGGLGKVNWELIAPPLKRGTTKTYQILGRVYYPYETKVIKPVWFVTTEEMRRIVQNGEALASDPQTQSAGPLTVTVTTGNFVRATDWRNTKFQLQIKIDNTGGGVIIGKDYPIAVTVDYPTWVMPAGGGQCPPQDMWATAIYATSVPLVLPQPIGRAFVKMWNSRSTDITCEFSIVQPPSSRTSGDFKVTLGYIYSVDTSTQITVKGMEEI
jgi:hypothetical protein